MNKDSSYSDQALTLDIQYGGARRERAMAHLYRSHVGAMVAFIVRQGGDEETARDIFQDAVVQLLLAVEQGTFQGNSTLRTYLFAVGKHLWFNRLRRIGTEQRYRETLPPAEARVLEQTPESRLLDQHQQALLQDLMGQLGDTCREVLTLWSMKYAMKEIAERVGYANEQTARNKKSKCLKALQELVRARPAVRTLVQELSSDQ